jgi:hypothetical protein
MDKELSHMFLSGFSGIVGFLESDDNYKMIFATSLAFPYQTTMEKENRFNDSWKIKLNAR